MLRPRMVPLRGLYHPLSAQSRIVIARRLQSTTSTVPPVSPTPPPPRKSRWGTFFRYTFRAFYISVIGGIVFFGYGTMLRNSCINLIEAYLARHPPRQQLKPDDKKKTLVILGSGWGSTSILKNLNTEGYHVIVVSPRNYFLFTRMCFHSITC